MKKQFLFICLMLFVSIVSYSAVKTINKPFVEGKGMRGWLIDSIQISSKNTLVYGHFGLGKGFTSSGTMNNFIEIPATGKRYKQTDLLGELPKSPKKIEGKGQQVSFVFVFPAIPLNTKVINVTSEDFDGTGAAWYGVWLTNRTSIFSEKLNHLPELEGNWYSVDGSGKWEAGFYENKIYYLKRFWNYKIVSTTENSATFELSDKQIESLTIKVSKTKNNELLLNCNNLNFVYRKEPIYTQPETSTFNSQLSNNDSVSITGYYRVANPVFSKKAALLVNDLFSLEPIAYPVNIDNDGTFTAKIPLKHTAKITFSNQLGPRSPLSQQSFMAERGDNIIFTYQNEDEKNVVFGGDNERFNNELHAFSTKSPHFVSRQKTMDKLRADAEKFVEWRKAEVEKLKTTYFDWQTKHPYNAKLNSYVFNAAKYGYAGDLLTAAINTKNDSIAQSALPSISNEEFYNNPGAVFSEDYLYFLQSLNGLYMSNQRLSPAEISAYLLKNGTFSNEDILLLENFQNISKSLKTDKDYQAYSAFMKENQKKISTLFMQNNDLTTKLQAEKIAESNSKFKLPEGFAKNYIASYKFAEILNRNERTLSKEELKKLTETCTDETFIKYISELNNSAESNLKSIMEGQLPQAVTMHTIPETETNITKAITDKFKGKVIYLDFWATWCGPCKGEMPYSKKQKEKLNGKNVVFVYLTGSSSPEVTWRKMIADIPGEHIRITGDQWNAICKKYEINGIPHYILFDKKGNVVNDEAPRPSSGENLIQEIKKLL